MGADDTDVWMTPDVTSHNPSGVFSIVPSVVHYPSDTCQYWAGQIAQGVDH